jgi:O-antigen/teichoic acid export membrane protein
MPISFSRTDLKILLSFGLWVTVSCLFSPILAMVDRFAIGAFVTAAAVTQYAIPFNLGDRLCIFGNAMGTALYPRFAGIDRSGAADLAHVSERVVAAVMLPVIVCAVFAIAPFLSLWIGRDFAAAAGPVGRILMVGVWMDATSRMSLYGLRGQFENRAVALIDLIQLVPFLLVLVVCAQFYGVRGVAVAYVFRVTLNYVLLSRQMGNLQRTLPAMGASLLLMGAAVAAASSFPFLTEAWIVSAFFTLLVSTAVAYRILPPSHRHELLGRLRWNGAS